MCVLSPINSVRRSTRRAIHVGGSAGVTQEFFFVLVVVQLTHERLINDHLVVTCNVS